MIDPKSLDIDQVRADTPGCEHRIHLNNAGAALMPRPVLDTMVEHLELESRIGGYEAQGQRVEAIEETYRHVGRLLGADSAHIAFTENATAAFNQALSSIPFERGDLILTTRNDYASNQIAYLSLQHRLGVRIERAPDHPNGGVDPMAMGELIHRLKPTLVAVTHVPTNSGLVQPIEQIGEICRSADTLYLVDACQSVGQIPLKVNEIGCDFLSATARKFLRGPRGAGFLFISERVLSKGLEPLLPDMRGADWIEEDLYQAAPDARRFESWEFPFALVLGMGEAARYAGEIGVENIFGRVTSLADLARSRLETIPGVRVLDRGEKLCGIVTISMEGYAPEAVVAWLRNQGINTAFSPRETAVIDYTEKGVEGAVRISPHYYNTEDEIEQLVDALRTYPGD